MRTTRTLVAVGVAGLLLGGCGAPAPEGAPGDGSASDGSASDGSASDGSGVTFEEHCDLRSGVLDLAAVAGAEGVVVTWTDESGHLGEASYRIARRATADDPWTPVATVALAPDAERRHVDAGATGPAEYTVAEDDGCADPSGDVCGPDQPCPVATTAARDD